MAATVVRELFVAWLMQSNFTRYSLNSSSGSVIPGSVMWSLIRCGETGKFMILPSLNQTLHLHIASNINSLNYKDLQNDTHFQDNTERKWIEARERRKTKQKKRCYESKHTCILLFKSVTALKAASTAGEAGS